MNQEENGVVADRESGLSLHLAPSLSRKTITFEQSKPEMK
jgi:hypothetical protein